MHGLHGSDVVLLCFSLTSHNSLRNCKAMWYPEIRRFCPQTPVLLVGCKNDLRYMYRDEAYLSYFRDRSPFLRAIRKTDLVMPDQARSIARELGVYYYETSVLTYYGVNEVFENAIRAALIARRQQRFWMTNLKKVQRPLLQAPYCPPKPRPPEIHVSPSTYEESLHWLFHTQAHADVIFVAGAVGFSAHRFILAAASPALHRLLCTDLTGELSTRSASESSMVSTFGEATSGDFNEDTEYLIRVEKPMR
ncbi:Rho- BTB domain-containing protein 1 [Homalodisca vitripennis]|nr:Rho- BTB domain-containing protein 1 [Homalodisca vitripennis]